MAARDSAPLSFVFGEGGVKKEPQWQMLVRGSRLCRATKLHDLGRDEG